MPVAARRFVLPRFPQDPDELHAFVHTVWNFNIPRHKVCRDHVAPFDAFCQAYFADGPVAIWKASRGLGGKSTMLAILSLTEAVALGAEVVILGGSAAQSLRVHEVTNEGWAAPYAPKHMLMREPTTWGTSLRNGAWLKAITASQRSARGPHPQRLRLDEIDEMDLSILEAAQGQPMDKIRNGTLVLSNTVMSSTHQYPDKTMTEMLKRANDKGWPIFEWCYRESMGTAQHPGWLTQAQVDRKRAEIPQHMWDTEYDLQEPSIEGRAIDTDAVERMFDKMLGTVDGEMHKEYIFEDPAKDGEYVTGVDWAKESDYTIITTWRVDVRPWRMVAFMRTGRKAWPAMVLNVEDRLKRYGGLLAHDSTGVGNVVDDLIQYDRRKTHSIVMVGREREIIFNDYVSAIEQDELRCPNVLYMAAEHRYVTRDDLFGRGGHPPDSVVSGALAWHVRNQRRPSLNTGSVPRESLSPWRTL